jgi:hypothetical protein
MKKRILTTLALSFISIMGFSQVIWDDFESNRNINYTFTNGGLNQAFTNPSTTGVNTSDTCARYGRSTVEYDVIVIDPAGSLVIDNVADYVSGAKKMSMKIYSPEVGLTVQITLENKTAAQPTNYPTGRHSEYTVVTTAANEWETIEFNFANRPDNSVANTSVDRMVILFAPATFNDQIFLFDDLMGPEFLNACANVTPDETIAEDFECQRNVSYSFINGNLVKEDNPNTTGNNPSESVGKFTKWTSGVTDGAFGGALSYPFTTSTYKSANIMLYNSTPGNDFLVIFQDASNNNLIERTFTTTFTNAWEYFEMDLTPIATTTNITNYVLLLNPGTQNEDVIYFDNFKLSTQVLNSTAKSNQITSNNFNVYPNPVTDKLTISTDEKISIIKLYDLTGKLLIENNNSKTLDVNTLQNGVYFVSVTFLNGNISTKKVVK